MLLVLTLEEFLIGFPTTSMLQSLSNPLWCDSHMEKCPASCEERSLWKSIAGETQQDSLGASEETAAEKGICF